MITICLINPPVSVYPDAPRLVVPPIELAYVAAMLRQKPTNHVTMLDTVAEGQGHEKTNLNGFVTLGLSLDEVGLRLAADQPAVAGIWFSSAGQAPNAYALCDTIKQLNKDRAVDITTVAIGPYATTRGKEVMRDLNVDYAIVGEAEQAFVQLTEVLTRFKQPETVPGVAWRNRQGDTVFNPPGPVIADLDLIPFPAFDLLQMQRYLFTEAPYGRVLKPHANMSLFRGCPHASANSRVAKMYGKEFRKRSPENIVEEVKYLKDAYGVKEVQFVGDDNFGDKKWALAWMKALEAAELDVKWSTYDGQSLHNLDLEIAQAAVSSGMRSLIVDFPTGHEEAYKRIYNRPGKLDGAAQLLTALRNANVFVGGLFSIGAPGETKAMMSRTVNYAMSLPLDELHISVLSPEPGTPFWDICESRNLFEVEEPKAEQFLSQRGFIKTSQFSSSDVLKLQHMAQTRMQLRNFLSQPGKLMPSAMKFLGHGVIHPIDFVVKVFRYMGSYAGFVSPPEKIRKRRRLQPKKKPAAASKNLDSVASMTEADETRF